MPILNAQSLAQVLDQNGNPVNIPGNMALMTRGPVVQVTLSIGQDIAQQLLQQGITLPTPEAGLALIDTGATSTCIDRTAAARMNLPVVDVVTMATAAAASTQHNVHPVSFEITGLPIQINGPRTIGVELQAQGLLALIGRDLLSACTLHYNGPTGGFTLSI